ncbi:hypothetical protein AB0G05_27280 [Nonomuraea wenchangensis]
MADTTEKTLADELGEAAARLREAPTDLATIKPPFLPSMPHLDIVEVGAVPLACCVDCGTEAEIDAVPAALVVALLNAREPLAAVLLEVADEAKRHEAQGMGNSQDEVVPAPLLAVARILNGATS